METETKIKENNFVFDKTMTEYGFEFIGYERPFLNFKKGEVIVGACYPCGWINDNGERVKWTRKLSELTRILDKY